MPAGEQLKEGTNARRGRVFEEHKKKIQCISWLLRNTHQDLNSIISYIAEQLANPTAASDFLYEVDKCCGYLKSNPMMYSKYTDSRLQKEGYRKVTY